MIRGTRIRPGAEKNSHGRGTPRPNRPMQGRRAIGIRNMKIGPMIQQAAKGQNLPPGVPLRPLNEPVCGVMQRTASAPTPDRVHFRSGVQQQPDTLDTMSRRREVQGRVPDINPMANPRVEEGIAREREHRPAGIPNQQ